MTIKEAVMKKGEASEEDIERAFRVYAGEGGRNIKNILGRLQSECGLKISAQTLYNWKRERGWERRMGEPSSIHEKMLVSLSRTIKKFEAEMEKAEKPDPQTVYAYINMLRAASELSKKCSRGFDPEKSAEEAKEILDADYGLKPL